VIAAGPMRHQVVIEQRSQTLDAVGEQLNTWTEFATRRARIVRGPGAEPFSSDKRNGRVPVTFELRHLEGVNSAMRVIFDGKVHDIVSAVDPVGLKEKLHLTVVEHTEETA
jgi:SPP1 family predicted phage head-tail adaptor